MIHSLLLLLVMAAVTLLTRALPFLLFDRPGELPDWISWLGRVLPPAIMALLVVYCLRNIDLLSASHGLPELLGVAAAALLHLWKGNTMLSIFGATVFYMLLIQGGLF
ncbi:MAG: AzlD domain-containing protein [Oscillospiraceae bacterium]|nr:AzlD domain-containing protein [Oscillospiraceae bacterium]